MYSLEMMHELFESDEAQHMRMYYDSGETGWAIRLPGERAAIANIPLTERLNLKDVVELDWSGNVGLPMAGEVVWRAYSHKSFVRYDEPHSETYRQIYEACREAGLACEGMYGGVCAINHHDERDVCEVLRDLPAVVEWRNDDV
jgi:hypothetical protein